MLRHSAQHAALLLRGTRSFADLTMHAAADLPPARKRLVYHAHRRGTKENDLLIGTFADRYAAAFTDQEARDFFALLQHEDPDLFLWITGKREAPDAVRANPMLARLQQHVRDPTVHRAWTSPPPAPSSQ